VVRWGGDEFVVVMPGVHVGEAEPRRRAVSDALQARGQAVSAGWASYGQGTDIMQAVEQADRAMYEDKARGKEDGKSERRPTA
jgi:GGDEF domain-containing protein